MKLPRKIIIIAAVCLGVFFGINHLRIYLTDNFSEVVAGELYRSAQMSRTTLETKIKENGIKSIINLRGRSESSYNQDDVAQSMGVKFFEFPISARQKLTPNEMSQLIVLMRDAPKPLLIHCRAGADRTGLATTLYLEDIVGQDPSIASIALSFAYGHYSLPFTGAYAMDESWNDHLSSKANLLASN